MDKVRGKFKVTGTKKYENPGTAFVFGAISDSSTPENELYHKYTPMGNLEMFVTNPSAEEFFKLGKSYYLDFTEADNE